MDSLLSAPWSGGGITEGHQAGNDTIRLTFGLEQVFQEGPDWEDPPAQARAGSLGSMSSLHSKQAPPVPGLAAQLGETVVQPSLTLPRSKGSRPRIFINRIPHTEQEHGSLEPISRATLLVTCRSLKPRR